MGTVQRTRRGPWTSTTVVSVDMFASEGKRDAEGCGAEAEDLTSTTVVMSTNMPRATDLATIPTPGREVCLTVTRPGGIIGSCRSVPVISASSRSEEHTSELQS